MTDEQIHTLFRTKQRQHHELRRELEWNALRRICRREDVGLVVRPHGEPAQLVGVDGTWCIIVDSRGTPRRHTYFAAHELAHLWLHVDQAEGREVVVFHFSDYEATDDPREGEAEYLTWLLLGGPRFHRHF